MNKRTRAALTLIVVSFLIISCADREQPYIPLRQSAVIPKQEDKPSNVLAKVGSIKVDGQDNIYVLDRRDKKVKVFNPDELDLREIGKAGQGPGEFQAPMDIFIYDQTLSVFDFANKRTSKYSLDGQYLGDVHLRQLGEFFRPEAEDEDTICGNALEYEADGSERLNLIKYDKRTQLITNDFSNQE